MRILVADDDLSTVVLIKELLLSWGYHVESCSDGSTALKILTSNQPPSIALLDWYMPSMTGMEVSLAASRFDTDRGHVAYRIIMSASTSKVQIVDALHQGIHDFILKPIERDLLKMRILIGEKFIRDAQDRQEMSKIFEAYATRMENLAQERARQLVHAERMSSLGTMCAGVAHEINNPLSFIAGNVQALETYWKDLDAIIAEKLVEESATNNKLKFIKAELPRALESMRSGVRRITKIVKSLKRYAVKESNTPQRIDLNDCVSQAIELSRAALGKGVNVTTNLSTVPLIVNGNALELEQVLVNLLVNAGQAMEGVPDAAVAITSKYDKQTVLLTVDDCGPGIPPEVISNIWEPFFTTKPVGKGTGLGLSISAGIIRDHKGQLIAMNRAEGGARFELRLPIYKDEAREQL